VLFLKPVKLAALKQYGFLNGIPPGFSPPERLFPAKAERTELRGDGSSQVSDKKRWITYSYAVDQRLAMRSIPLKDSPFIRMNTASGDGCHLNATISNRQPLDQIV